MSQHPAASIPMEDRREYLFLLASFLVVDPSSRRSSRAAVTALEAFCDGLAVDEPTRHAILGRRPQPDPSRVRLFCERLRGSPLRLTLVGDLLHLAHIDGAYSAPERESIENTARFLGLTFVQLDQLTEYAARNAAGHHERITADQVTRSVADEGRANATAGLLAFATSLGAVFLAGGGMSGDAVVDGLQRLGAGVGLWAGIAVSWLFGAAVFFAVRFATGARMRLSF